MESENNETKISKVPKQLPEEEGGTFKELFKFALIVIVIVVPIRLFVAQPFIVSGQSMEPNFKDKEYLIVDELSYRFSNPTRGDVIIFKFPSQPKKYLIKRIIGLPGETVSIENSSVIVTNAENPGGFVIEEPYIENKTDSENFTLTLSDDEYFVLGDNRPVSSDSRVWGALSEDMIVGRPFLRLYPFSLISIFPGIDQVVYNN
ncbi:MAG: signal peptidase I [Parcubacteria group bacterium CG11_big_fil_rev_8_21_14_0_20_39_22]|nr:MAG: signal peptidase I [Parcubacteria group bacterium CG11_big_fil_rev_8_21_14_0_20_39_22]